MNNQELHKWLPYSLCDSHLHLTYEQPVKRTAEIFTGIMKHFCYERILLNCLPHSSRTNDPSDNLKGLYCKSVMNAVKPNSVYVFGGLYHYFDERDTAEGYLNQARAMYAQGVDGYKLLEGKPYLRKRLNRRLDDPIFDGFYGFAEENSIPITLHLGDPAYFWDITKVNDYIIKAGWYCDETYPSLDELRGEVSGILNKFPNLYLNLAHFYFLSDDLEACEEFFETRNNVSLDLTPGGEMFVGFTARPDEWRSFFKKYSKRIYYGTDTYNNAYSVTPEEHERNSGHRINLVRRMLETSEPFADKNYGTLQPMALDDTVLTDIYHDNFIRRFGNAREIDENLVGEEIMNMLSLFENGTVTTCEPEHDKLEISNLHTMYEHFLMSDMVSN